MESFLESLDWLDWLMVIGASGVIFGFMLELSIRIARRMEKP